MGAYQCAIGEKYYFNPLTSSIPLSISIVTPTYSAGGIAWSGGPASWNWQSNFDIVNAGYSSNQDLTLIVTIVSLGIDSGLGYYNNAFSGTQFVSIQRNGAGAISFNFPGQGSSIPNVTSPIFPMKLEIRFIKTGIYYMAHVFLNGAENGSGTLITTFNGGTFQHIEIAGYGTAGQFLDWQIINDEMAEDCQGFDPDPFPVVMAEREGNPYQCDLGKNTSWFLEEFEDATIPVNWALKAGIYHAVNGYLTLPDSEETEQKLEIEWAGKVLNFAQDDHLSIEIRGRVDALNLGAAFNVYDAFGIKITLPDLANWVMIAVRRDSTDPTLYRIVTSESFGADQLHTLTPAFTAYPMEVTLRIDLYPDSVSYFVNGIEINSENFPTGSPVTYAIPRIFLSHDTVHRGYIYYCYISGTPGFPNLCEGVNADRTLSYRSLLINLLPLGFPWRNLNQIFQLFLTAFAVEPGRVHTSSDDLLREANPGTSTLALLLPDWERMALLPDEKPTGGETEAARQAVVAAKVFTVYTGQSRQFFIDLAARMGIPIEIQDGGYFEPARVGIARVGSARVNSASNMFIWNVQILLDTFVGVTPYWVYDGDEDLTTYPGYLAALAPANSTFVTFQGGPLFPTWPVLSMNAVYPVIINFSLRCIFSGVVNKSFMVTTWAADAGFLGDFVQFNFFYSVADGTYQIDLSGTQSGAPYAVLVDTGIELLPDVEFRFNITIDPFGFIIRIPEYGITTIQGGFDFPTLEYLDLSAQRPDAANQGMFAGIGVYTDDPALQFAKLKRMIARLKPAHTEVTYS